MFGEAPAREAFERLFHGLAHRGPDGSGSYSDALVHLGMHRLQFRGAACELPIRGQGTVTAYNGQVYGWYEAHKRLHGIEEGLLQEVSVAAEYSAADGMFAYARYRPTEERIDLATDAHFIKPLFLQRDPRGFAFSSEIGALLAESGPSTIHMQALAELFRYGWYLSDQSCATNVCLVWKQDYTLTRTGAQKKPKLASLTAMPSPPQPAALRQAIRCAVEKSASGTGPLGLALSGGLDSSILAFELNSLGVEDLTCVTVSTGESDDELSSLAELDLPPGGAWRTWKHVRVRVDECNFLDAFETSTRLFGQPTTMSSLPLYLKLADAASEAGVRALILGEGADEYFAGYSSYAKVGALASPLEYYNHDPRERLVCQLFGHPAVQQVQERFQRLYGDLSDIRLAEAQLRLSRLLLRSDVCLMARSIEGRVPFLYNNIPALGLSLPWSELAAAPGKRILRQAYSELIGDRAWRAKVRFKSPDSVLLRCLESKNLETRIVENCAGVFGVEEIRGAMAMLRRPGGFDADVFCLLASLSFLIEGGLFYGDDVLT